MASHTPDRPGRATVTSLPTEAERLLTAATTSSARRAGHTLLPGAHSALKQTLLALAAGASLNEHESPTAATLQVLQGRVRLVVGNDQREMATGDFAPIPPARHSVEAVEDAVMLLTVVQ